MGSRRSEITDEQDMLDLDLIGSEEELSLIMELNA